MTRLRYEFPNAFSRILFLRISYPLAEPVLPILCLPCKAAFVFARKHGAQPHYTSKRSVSQFLINSPIVCINLGPPVLSLTVWLGLNWTFPYLRNERITRIISWHLEWSVKNKRRVEASLFHSLVSLFWQNHCKALNPIIWSDIQPFNTSCVNQSS